MYFIEGSNFNRVQKYFSGRQKYSSGGSKILYRGSHFNRGQKYFIERSNFKIYYDLKNPTSNKFNKL